MRNEAVSSAIAGLETGDLTAATRALLHELGYASSRTLAPTGEPVALLRDFGLDPATFEDTVPLERWRSFDLVFQLTGDELPALMRGSKPAAEAQVQKRAIEGFLFFALDLDPVAGDPSRSALVSVVRKLNQALAMPAIVMMRHGREGRRHATLAVIDRRANLRDAGRDVIEGRISLVKDIDLARPHRAHVDIVAGLSLGELHPAPLSFRDLYDRWLDALSVQELNKSFYRELSNWFAWASSEKAHEDSLVVFPPGQGNRLEDRQTALIRLLTRLMFVWFVRQKDLVPHELFDRDELKRLMKSPPHEGGQDYYPAILQNLFFACLNTEMDARGWLARDRSGRTTGYLVANSYRGRDLFKDPDAAANLFNDIPFLNGGLFDCLDRNATPDDPAQPQDAKAPRATGEGGSKKMRVDGFSDEAERRPRLADQLFFDGATGVDLSAFYGTAKSRSTDVRGLIDLFQAYKFTIEENTPLEEEAALDPELLGKVFENLLGAFNPETRETARKNSGSFYTPREVVDFMVDEALISYLRPVLDAPSEGGLGPDQAALELGAPADELGLEGPQLFPLSKEDETVASDRQEARLRDLLAYGRDTPSFSEQERRKLVDAIESCRTIDPAVGSGAFPLGLLQKLVHVLKRLDPNGEMWRAANRKPLEDDLDNAHRHIDGREERVEEAERRLKTFDETFASGNYADYTRKLYLIEGGLYGVDIQPVAIQIAKLRCFIALAVEQKVDDALPNRGVTPLPNLEMKFVAANSLGQLKRQGQLTTQAVNELRLRLRSESRALFSVRTRSRKRKLTEKLTQTRKALFEEVVTSADLTSEDLEALSRWDPFDANAVAPFLDPGLMFALDDGGKGGWFDVVLANPPYVRHEKIAGHEIDGEPATTKPRLKDAYPDTYAGTADLYVYFYDRALSLLRSGRSGEQPGTLSFITSNKWFRAGYGRKLRTHLARGTEFLKVIDFGDADVFDAIAYPTIVVARKRDDVFGLPKTRFAALNWREDAAVEDVAAEFATHAFAMPQDALSPDGWQLERSTTRDMLTRLKKTGTPLGEWCKGRIYRGVLTGLNEAFVIDGEKRAELIEADPGCEVIIKPFLRGRDVKRWGVQPQDKWLIFTRRGTDVGSHSSVKRHLEQYRTKLEPKPKGWRPEGKESWPGRKTGSYQWFEIQDQVNYWQQFEEPKLYAPALENKVAFALDERGFFGNDKTSIIVDPRRVFLLSVLNSSLSWWYVQQKFASRQGGFYEFKPMYLAEFPVPPATEVQQANLSAAVEAILAGAERRSAFEGLINAMVYELFFAPEFEAAELSVHADARAASLFDLAAPEGETEADRKARAARADEWALTLLDPESHLFATLYAVQSLAPVRIIEGRDADA